MHSSKSANPGTEAPRPEQIYALLWLRQLSCRCHYRVSLPADWASRYRKYIPGYKWQDQANWQIQPAIAVQDLNIDPMVKAGDVFVLGDIQGTGNSGYPWWASQQCDIDFGTQSLA